jgi:hypothetical protein
MKRIDADVASMADFVSSEDIKREVEKLRDLLNDGQSYPNKKSRRCLSRALLQSHK